MEQVGKYWREILITVMGAILGMLITTAVYLAGLLERS